jgi:hypothetical protein
MHTRSDEYEDIGGHVIPVAPTITEHQREFVASVVRAVQEGGKAIDQQFPDVLGKLNVDRAITAETCY